MKKTRIGFIGLGALGRPMAERLLKRDFPLVAYNRTASKAKELTRRGARVASTPADAAREADVVITVVGDDRALESVCLGEGGLASGLRPGTTHLEMSTISPELAKRVAERVQAAGGEFLDAPVLGSGPQAIEGSLILMIGGDRKIMERRLEVLEALGKKIVHTGAVGSASHLKLVANQFITSMMLAFAQGMTLAQKAGLSPDLVLEVIDASALRSPFYAGKLQRLTSRTYQPNFPCKQMLKDIDLMLQAGGNLGVPLPSMAAAREVYVSAVAQGLGEQDYSVIIETLEAAAGLPGRERGN